MNKLETQNLVGDIASTTIDYIYETVASQLDWHDFGIDEDVDENAFMEAHESMMLQVIEEITKQLTNLT